MSNPMAVVGMIPFYVFLFLLGFGMHRGRQAVCKGLQQLYIAVQIAGFGAFW